MNSSSVSPQFTYPFPEGVAASEHFEVFVEGEAAFVYACEVGAFVAFECAAKTEIVIQTQTAIGDVIVRPLSRALQPQIGEKEVRLTLDEPQNLFIELGNGLPPLFVFANPPMETLDASDPDLVLYRAGQVYEAGTISLRSGQTLFIEAGAVVRGWVHALEADNVRVAGYGVLDGTGLEHGSVRLMTFEGCRNVRVEGITTMATPSWNLVFGACENVHVNNVKLIGWVVGSDGIDVVGSRDVRIENSFFRTNDDCIAIKAVEMRPNIHLNIGWDKPVENVLVQKCVLYNDAAGNAMEIGFETQTESIRGVVFRDCDVIGAHGEGGVFTIHNGDRANISDVLWEDIRVEHFYTLLIDFRVLDSRWSYNTTRGTVRNVTLRNIRTIPDRYNTLSLIGGCDAQHTIEGVTIEDFQIGEKTIASFDELNLYTKHAADIVVRP